MIKDSDDCFEDLAKSYPELMEKSRIGDMLGVDVGWFNIIDSLCSCIYEPVSSAKNRLKAATEYPRNDGGQYLSECEERYKRALSELPAIIDIKEKAKTIMSKIDDLEEVTKEDTYEALKDKILYRYT